MKKQAWRPPRREAAAIAYHAGRQAEAKVPNLCPAFSPDRQTVLATSWSFRAYCSAASRHRSREFAEIHVLVDVSLAESCSMVSFRILHSTINWIFRWVFDGMFMILHVSRLQHQMALLWSQGPSVMNLSETRISVSFATYFGMVDSFCILHVPHLKHSSIQISPFGHS